MITRRSALALAALLPATNFPRRLDVEEIEHVAVATPEINNYSLSPDGSKIFGTVRNLDLEVLDIATNRIIARVRLEYNEPAVSGAELFSFTWSPDSRRLAWSMARQVMMGDSDLNVLDIETSAVDSLTAEGFATNSDRLKTDAVVYIDVYPTWLNNDVLLFARSEGLASPTPPSINSINIADGSIEPFVDLAEMNIERVATPIHRVADGRLVLQATFESRDSGIIVIAPDGTMERVNTEAIFLPSLLDANESHAVVLDGAVGRYALVPLDGEGETVFADEFFSNTSEPVALAGSPICGPNANEFAALVEGEDAHRVVIMRDGERRSLGKLDKSVLSPLLDWQGDRILVGDREKYWLIDVTD